MPKCRRCGKQGFFLKLHSGGICSSCQAVGKFIDQQPIIKLTTEFSSYYVEIKQKTPGLLPRASLSGYRSLSGGYVNYTRFYVTGKNPETKRKNKRLFMAKNEASAIEMAKINGLIEPFDVYIDSYELPTERQIAFARDLGAIFPEDACKQDISAIISRIVDDDEDCPSEDLAQEADNAGLNFSMFLGNKKLFSLLCHQGMTYR